MDALRKLGKSVGLIPNSDKLMLDAKEIEEDIKELSTQHEAAEITNDNKEQKKIKKDIGVLRLELDEKKKQIQEAIVNDRKAEKNAIKQTEKDKLKETQEAALNCVEKGIVIDVEETERKLGKEVLGNVHTKGGKNKSKKRSNKKKRGGKRKSYRRRR
jgi:hypothetical protein